MRLDPRVAVAVPIEVDLPAELGGERIRLETVNLSPSGALCRSPRRLEPDLELSGRLTLAPPGEDPVTVPVEAVVIRVQGAGGEGRQIALHFVRLEPGDRDLLRRFVFARQAAATRASSAS